MILLRQILRDKRRQVCDSTRATRHSLSIKSPNQRAKNAKVWLAHAVWVCEPALPLDECLAQSFIIKLGAERRRPQPAPSAGGAQLPMYCMQASKVEVLGAKVGIPAGAKINLRVNSGRIPRVAEKSWGERAVEILASRRLFARPAAMQVVQFQFRCGLALGRSPAKPHLVTRTHHHSSSGCWRSAMLHPGRALIHK